jgi:hypothetical protein
MMFSMLLDVNMSTIRSIAEGVSFADDARSLSLAISNNTRLGTVDLSSLGQVLALFLFPLCSFSIA